MVTNLEVIFDNGGGITVQCDEFAHNYDDAKRAAEDVRGLLSGADPSGWDGNEIDSRVEWDYENIRNGGYKVYDVDDLTREIDGKDPISVGWCNVDDFLAALTGR